MDWIIGLLLLVAGGVIGFFIAKYYFDGGFSKAKTQSNEQQVKELMAQQANGHIQQSRDIIDSLQTQCENLSLQLDNYQSLLNSASQDEDTEQLSYFGQDADLIIRNKLANQKRKRVPTESQPRDFSSGGSGLFDGSKNQQVADTQK
jgi:uncharacterized membrane-anchored protein YhcB (DUF1043 family)